MSEWIVGADALARARFEISHLAVALAVTAQLASRGTTAVDPALDGDPVGTALITTGLQPRWIADCFTLAVPPGDCLDHELEVLRRYSDEQVRRDLVAAMALATTGARRAHDATALPAILGTTSGLGARAANALTRIWDEHVAGDWERQRWILESDIVSRTTALSRQGWAGALEGMRPGTAYLGGGTIRISGHDLPPRDLTKAHLALHPVPGERGFVMWDLTQDRYALTYPATGSGLNPAGPKPDDSLERLIGANRARILAELTTPASTSQLVARTGLSLGSVGRHLAILHDAGIITRRRAGREVLYWRTCLGESLSCGR